MTNMIITPNQTRSRCPEDPRFVENKCKVDTDCLPALQAIKNGNGTRSLYYLFHYHYYNKF